MSGFFNTRIQPLMAELRTAMNHLESVEAKLQQTDKRVKELELCVNDYVRS